jgi:excinuclease UvrABC nuclease subunit
MKIGTLRITANKFKMPCIYELIDAKGELLYVGFSSKGFTRAFHSYGCKFGRGGGGGKRAEVFDVAETIRVTVFDNSAEARAEETRLIMLYKPRYNTEWQQRIDVPPLPWIQHTEEEQRQRQHSNKKRPHQIHRLPLLHNGEPIS